jgi:serine phosphatase RsbU (regulator of sigma subunit)
MTASVPAAVLDAVRVAAVRATRLLDTPPEEAFDELALLASTLLDAPLAFVTLVDESRSFWKSCVGVATTGPGRRQNPVEESFCQYVVASREPLIVGDAARDERTRENASIAKMGFAAWAGFPIFDVDDHALGSFCVVDTVVRDWTDRDVAVLSALARSASREIALRNVAERAAALARTLQESLLPPLPPDLPGLEVAARFRPAGEGVDVVGDFYDVFESAPGVWTLVMGDVCGKGIEAAKVTALARYTLRAVAIRGSSPHAMLEQLNTALLSHSPAPSLFLTAVVAAVRPGGGGAEVLLACAGHPPPLVLRADGSIDAVACRGSLLGVFADVSLHDARIALAPGDTLILYTDGVTDARRNESRFGDEGLARIVAGANLLTAAEIAERVDEAVADYADGLPVDDAAVLVLRVPSGPPEGPLR